MEFSTPLTQEQSMSQPSTSSSVIQVDNTFVSSEHGLPRKVNQYNSFCANRLSSEELKVMPMKERMRVVAAEYTALSKEEKSLIPKKTASTVQDRKRQTEKEILASRKRILKELTFMGERGVAATCVLAGMPDPNYIHLLENSKAKAAGVAVKEGWDKVYESYFKGTSNNRSTLSRKQAEDCVRGIFNTKWAEAGFKGKTPAYNKKDSFTLMGIPEGLKFRRPQDYGTNQLKKLIAAQEKLCFVSV